MKFFIIVKIAQYIFAIFYMIRIKKKIILIKIIFKYKKVRNI